MTDPNQANPNPLRVIPVPQLAEGVGLKELWGSFTAEHPDDRRHRLRQESADATHKRWRATALFTTALVGLIFICWLCAQVLGNPQSSPDDKKWATAIIASVISGAVGFVTGKAIA